MGLGIKDLRFHDLRHEAISRIVLKQRHLSVFEIMKIVGHSSIEMLNRYANLRGEELSRKLID
jgi:integrase